MGDLGPEWSVGCIIQKLVPFMQRKDSKLMRPMLVVLAVKTPSARIGRRGQER
jgi:hypothetical protein